MTETANKVDVTTSRVRRIARIWSIVVIGFTLFMLVAHIVGPDEHTVDDYPPIENLLPVLMSVSVFSLALAWRWERLGGILNISFFVANLLLYWAIHGRFFPVGGALLILSMAIVPGVLFLVCWWRMRCENL